MSYKITVPLISNSAESMGLEEHLEELKRLNAERVLLSIERYYISEETKKKELFTKVRKGDVRVLIGSTSKMRCWYKCARQDNCFTPFRHTL